MDEPIIDDDPNAGKSIVTLKATNHWADFGRRLGRRTNYEEQNLFLGDMGLEFTSEINKEIRWGSA